jgi:hypothetical protein
LKNRNYIAGIKVEDLEAILALEYMQNISFLGLTRTMQTCK